MQTTLKCLLSMLALPFLLSTTGILGCDSTKGDEGPYQLEAGIWSSEQARLQVKEKGATITFPCAMGNIENNIQVNQDGEFEVTGTMVAGPLGNSLRPARFEGRIAGNKLTLTITYTDTSEEFGVFELTKGYDSGVGYICVC